MSENSGANPKTLAQIRKRLSRHLEATGGVLDLSKQFGALGSNYERVDFVLDLLRSADFEVEFRSDSKSEDAACQLREEGNRAFKMGRLEAACQLYTQSSSAAEEDGVNISLAFANRSAVSLKGQMYAECLVDIERAVRHNYPEHLKPKLVSRAERCNTFRKIITWYETVPVISDANGAIECAHECLKIQEDENFGRFVTTTRDVKAGEVLVHEKPFASLLVNEFFSHCHECLNLCYILIPCKSCTQSLYCSEECRAAALETYHKYECPILKTLNLLELGKFNKIALKIALLARYQDIEGLADEVYRSGRYKEIHNLVANTSKRSVADLFERATAAAVMFNLVKTHTGFFDTTDERFFKDVLLLHTQTGPSNFHEITELVTSQDGYKPEEIASGAYAFLSLFNHSCSPNVTRFCYGSTLVLRAIKDIKKGEQCFDNYGYHHSLMPKASRQKHLQDQYCFSCVCQACQNDWSLYHSLPSLGRGDLDDLDLFKLSSGELKEASLELLQTWLPKLSELSHISSSADINY